MMDRRLGRRRSARVVLPAALMLAVAALLAGCGGASRPAAGASTVSSAVATAPAGPDRISERSGPSWQGRLGETVRIDWYDQATDTTTSELVTVLGVKLVATTDDAGPGGIKTASPPVASGYDWRYAIKVRLESLDERAARRPVAYQFLMLSDGETTQTGIGGLGAGGGPDPSQPGKSSTGRLYQWAEEGFRPTQVTLPVGAWQATWVLGE